jgi:hypothetical protein
MKKGIISIIIVVYSIKVFPQTSIKNISGGSNLKEVKNLYHFLLTRPVDTSKNWMFIPEQIKFYDSAVNLFFDREAMLKIFDSLKLGNINLQYAVLHGVNSVINYVSPESIFIEKKLEYYKKNPPGQNIDSNKLRNDLFAGFIINEKFYPLVEMRLEESGKLLFLLPMIWFDDAEGKIVSDFLNRHSKSFKSIIK